MTTGAGFVPFGVGPFGSDSIAWSAQVRAQIPSSRYIDGAGRFKFVDDFTGGFDGMNDSLQSAYILISKAVPKKDKITASSVEELRADIVRALEPLTGGTEPRLELRQVVIDDSGVNRLDTYVEVRDLLDGGIKVFKL